MSSLTINGKVIFSTSDSHAVTTRTTVSTKAPSWDTHRLVDGQWMPKVASGMTSGTSSVPTKAPIGFTLPTPPATPVLPSAPVSYLGSRKEYLRAIEVAAGHCLLKGTDHEAIEAIRRGRLGGRKDNMGELHGLLSRYTKGSYS
jgi:hypothetical protein